MTHVTYVEGQETDRRYRVVCSCGWLTDYMGLGDAWTTAGRGLADVGHAAFARALEAAARGVI